MKIKEIKNKKLKIFLVLIFIGLLIVIYSLARYVVEEQDFHIQQAEAFYFNSSVLKENNQIYYAKDWNGEGIYSISIDLNNFEDSIRKTNTNINYSVSAQTDNSKVTVTPSEQTGTITSNETSKTVNINLLVNNGMLLSDGENIQVVVQVNSTSPYAKQLSGTFNICKNSESDYSASIIDSANSEYAVLSITTKQLNSAIILSYDATKSTLDTTNEIFNNVNTINSSNILLNLESFKNYNLEFIKKVPANILILGTDIVISTTE